MDRRDLLGEEGKIFLKGMYSGLVDIAGVMLKEEYSSAVRNYVIHLPVTEVSMATLGVPVFILTYVVIDRNQKTAIPYMEMTYDRNQLDMRVASFKSLINSVREVNPEDTLVINSIKRMYENLTGRHICPYFSERVNKGTSYNPPYSETPHGYQYQDDRGGDRTKNVQDVLIEVVGYSLEDIDKHILKILLENASTLDYAFNVITRGYGHGTSSFTQNGSEYQIKNGLRFTLQDFRIVPTAGGPNYATNYFIQFSDEIKYATKRDSLHY